MLLDLDHPQRVIGLCRAPLLVPEAPSETSGGIRNNVIFPGGMILEDTGKVESSTARPIPSSALRPPTWRTCFGCVTRKTCRTGAADG